VIEQCEQLFLVAGEFVVTRVARFKPAPECGFEQRQ